jgi:hypothetical protein
MSPPANLRLPVLAKLKIGDQAKDASKPKNAPPGRASAVEAAARQLQASLSGEHEAVAKGSAWNADRSCADMIRTKKAEAVATAKLAKDDERVIKAQVLEQRRQRLAASVAAIEKKGEKQSPFNPSHETRYCLARNAKDKLAFITDSLLDSEAGSGKDSKSEPSANVFCDDELPADHASAEEHSNSPSTRYALPTPTTLCTDASNKASKSPAEQITKGELVAHQFAAVAPKQSVATPSPVNPLKRRVRRQQDAQTDSGATESAAADGNQSAAQDDESSGDAASDKGNAVTNHTIAVAAEKLATTSLGKDIPQPMFPLDDVKELLALQKEEFLSLLHPPEKPEASSSMLLQLVDKVGTLCEQVVSLQARPQAQPVVRSAVRINDIKLAVFHGNADSNATYIARPYYLPLIRWIKEGTATLQHSGLRDPDQCTVVLNHLAGAARSAFFAKYGSADRSTWKLDDLYHNIANLVPDYAVLFTREAFAMQFRVKTLVDDIDTFAMYLRYGCFSVDGNQYVFSELQRKILDACPKIFTLAADLHNLRLVWTPGKSFSWHVSKAIVIVNTLQAEQLLLKEEIRNLKDSGATTNGRAGYGTGNGEKRKQPSAPGGKNKRPRFENDKASKTGKDARYKELAKTYMRCLKCGMHVPNGDWKAHAADANEKTKCKPAQFMMRMGKVASMVDAGKGDKVNEFAKK